MPTKNRRVATYLPPELDDRLKTFIGERNLKGESQALITILSEFFGVSYPVAQQVDYSAFVTQEQFRELSDRLQGLIESNEKSSSPNAILSKLLERVEQIESRLNNLESCADRETTLSNGDLAKRLGIDSSTLSHWKSSGKKGKSPDELLKATREKDPDGIGWIIIPATGRFKPEREISFSSPVAHQSELPIDS
jgi:hypothetical protein